MARCYAFPINTETWAVAGKRSYASQTIPVLVVITILLDYTIYNFTSIHITSISSHCRLTQVIILYEFNLCLMIPVMLTIKLMIVSQENHLCIYIEESISFLHDYQMMTFIILV